MLSKGCQVGVKALNTKIMAWILVYDLRMLKELIPL